MLRREELNRIADDVRSAIDTVISDCDTSDADIVELMVKAAEASATLRAIASDLPPEVEPAEGGE